MNQQSAAKFLGTTRQNVAEWEKTEAGFPQRIEMGKRLYFRTADLINYVNNKATSTSAKPTVVDRVKKALKTNTTYVLDSVRV